LTNEVSVLEYFSPSGIHVFAHRGLVSGKAAENTLKAFQDALDAGATHLETDVQATKDGVAVLFHDNTLERVAGINRDVKDLTFEQLRQIELPGGPIVSLQEALEKMPDARFNLDIKRSIAIEPTVRAIVAAKGHNRVLVSSFSDYRRRKAMRLLRAKGLTVATGMGLAKILLAVLAAKLRMRWLFNLVAQGSQAIQVPYEHPLINPLKPRFIEYVLDTGLQLNYWVVNEAQTMHELVGLGATGIVSDRADVAAKALRH
jgi:glycerophosphoryl diester phosphodiesterase